MPVEKADRLLKAAGYEMGYETVYMQYSREGHPLQWGFTSMKIPGMESPVTDMMVDILTGEVKPAPTTQSESLALKALRGQSGSNCTRTIENS